MAGEYSEVGVHIGITSDTTAKIDAIIKKLAKFGASQKYADQLNKRFNHLTNGLTNLTKKQEKNYKSQAAGQIWTRRMGVSTEDLNRNMKGLGMGFTKTGKFASIQTGAIINQQKALRDLTNRQRELNAFQGKAWQKAHMQRITETASRWNMSSKNLSSALQKESMYINKQGQVVSFATGKIVTMTQAEGRLMSIQTRLTTSTSRFKAELVNPIPSSFIFLFRC